MAGESAAVFVSRRELFRPPPDLALSAWADEHFYLSPESSAEPGRWKTLPYQREVMDAISDPKVERVSWMKSARVGAALSLDTPLPTPDGWTTMGEIAEGDALLGDDGRPCRVTAKSPVFVGHECFRVSFCDGSSVIADAGHRWLVESDVSVEHLESGRTDRSGRPGPGATATRRAVVDTATMGRLAIRSRGRRSFAIVNARALELPAADLPVPPYALGAWLGDGHKCTPRITAHRTDAVELAANLERAGIRPSIRYIDRRYPDNAAILWDVPATGKPISPWASILTELGVLNNKHAPMSYLRASRSQRLELLRGLMDTDGTCGKNGRAEFTNTNRGLCDAVYDLVTGLGMKASIARRPPSAGEARGRKYTRAEAWRVNFKPTPEMNPFRFSRKAERVKVAAKPSITFRRRVVSVEPIESVPVQCVSVDNASSLYLAGLGKVPTHNTKILNITIGYYMDQDPAPIMGVQPTIEDAKGYSGDEITPMLRDVPVLRALVGDPAVKTAGQTIKRKEFPGGVLQLVGANSATGFRRVSRRIILLDEIDAYPASAGDDGDPVELAEKRSEYFHNRKIVAMSTPLLEGSSRIKQLFEEGDQRRFHVPCPHCGHRDFLKFSPEADRGHWMAWDDGDPETAHFVCRESGCVIEHHDKLGMLESGEWIAEAPFAGHASFHIWAAYSTSPNSTWAKIAAKFLKVKDKPTQFRVFVNTVLGETWVDRGQAPKWRLLFRRREAYRIGTVPRPVEVLTGGVDVQKDRFVWEVVGWGLDKQAWVIDAGILWGDTSDAATWRQLDALLGREYPSADGARLWSIAKLAIDSGYNTQEVYNWARKYRIGWRVIACKGVATARSLLGTASAVELNISGRRIANGYKIWPVAPHIAKTELYGWLGLGLDPDDDDIDPAGDTPPGYVHFPELDEEFFKQLTGEQLVSVINKKTGFTTHQWQLIPGRENHWLDTHVLNRAAAAAIGLDRVAPPPTPGGGPPTHKPTPAPSRRPQRPQSRDAWIKPRDWFGRKR